MHSSLCHAPQGPRGPNRGSCAHQGPALRHPLWQSAVPTRALQGVLTSARPSRHARRSLAARGRRAEDRGSTRSRLRPPAPSRGKVSGVGTWEGGWDGLASAVRARLPSAQSARLQRLQLDDPFGHPALDSPVCATRSHCFSDLQLQRDQLSTNGLHSGRANREISATMEPNLSGRTVRGLQSRHKALSETYREKFSDLAKLQLDQAGSGWARRPAGHCMCVRDGW